MSLKTLVERWILSPDSWLLLRR